MIVSLSMILMWIVIIALTAVVISMARQIGILHERIAPMGALVTSGGLAAGDSLPSLRSTTIDGAAFRVGPDAPFRQRTLLMFVSANCPVCAKLIPIVQAVAAAESIDLIFVGDADVAEQRALIARYRIGDHLFVNGPELGRAIEVAKLPYAVLVRTDGVIAAKGLVSNREHVESLFNADDSGFRSAQAYVRSLPHSHDHDRSIAVGASQ